jgi:drug/metabolite transporter (DMT)-like permease
MHAKHWHHTFKGAARFWIAALVFIVVGIAFVVVGILGEELFLFIGTPFLFLGTVVLALLAFSLYIRLRHPEDHDAWLWWVNFVGGLSGALLFSIPSMLALPILLLVSEDDEALLVGAVFSVIGLATTIVVGMLARRQVRGRPRWVSDALSEGEQPPAA